MLTIPTVSGQNWAVQSLCGGRPCHHPADHTPLTLRDVPSGGSFPDRPTGFVHDLDGDERLSLGAIAALADRLQQSVVHDNADKPLLVPDGGPPRGALERPGDVIRGLDTAKSWLTLLNVEQDPDYADLMHSTLHQLEPGMLGSQGKMRNPAAFIIVSSPHSVTPAHFDIENSLLMQVSGAKTVSVGRFVDATPGADEIERYWDGSHGRVASMPTQEMSFPMTPGSGVYIPTLSTPLGPQRPGRVDLHHTHLLHQRQRAPQPDRGPERPYAAPASVASAAGGVGGGRRRQGGGGGSARLRPHHGSGIGGAAGRGGHRAQG